MTAYIWMLNWYVILGVRALIADGHHTYTEIDPTYTFEKKAYIFDQTHYLLPCAIITIETNTISD